MTVLESSPLIREVTPSPAGPTPEGIGHLKRIPGLDLPLAVQVLRFNRRQKDFIFASARSRGDVFHMRGTIKGGSVIVSHPDHVKSIFTANPKLVPTLTTESPLAPVVGPHAVLTTNGARHLSQRKMLLPPFHGKSVEQYQQVIRDATSRQLDRWKPGETINLSLAMQSLTLEVILAGVFGVGRQPTRKERTMTKAVKWLLEASTTPLAQISELMHVGRTEAFGGMKWALAAFDKTIYDVIEERRHVLLSDGADARPDVLSLLLQATDEDLKPLPDQELRDQLVSLLLAGHETTANTIAWAYERLTRTPQAYDDLRDAARSGDAEQASAMGERVMNEAMRSRPVIPIVGRRTTVDWQLGEYGLPAGSAISASILLTHHREDLYPRAADFIPGRWEGHKPGTYTWIPFGGGTRRCLGAALALAELRHVIPEIARRFDLEADRPEPERPLHRNVTMIPARGGSVRVTARLA